MPKRALITAIAVAVCSAVAVAAGCGGDDGNESTQPATTSSVQQGAARNVTVKMGEYFFKPKDVTVAPGKVTITAPNQGKAEHELVLLKTDTDPGKLKTEKDGEVVEEAYSGPGEIPDVEAGDTGKATLNLKRGRYAMICNVPGHYKAGMYGSVTVK